MPLQSPQSPPSASTMEEFLVSPIMSAKAILADLDGTLISGQTVLPHVDELMEQAGDKIWLVSNNSTQTAQTMSQHLSALGLSIAPERIFLAGETALRALAGRHPAATIAFFGETPLRELAISLGLTIHRGTNAANFAFLAREEAFTFADLSRLLGLLYTGTELHLSNPDPIYPNANGTIGAETGAIFAALKAGLPDLQAECLGKPSAHLIELALKTSGVSPHDAVVIGDTNATDGEAARAAGVPFILIARPQICTEVTP